MKTARVQDFSLILTGLLTQYDQKESLREMRRGGGGNIYRLGHLLRAAQVAEDKAKKAGIWTRDDPEAVAEYDAILREEFIFEGGRFALAPLRQLQKQMKAWIEKRKLPTYGSLRDNPDGGIGALGTGVLVLAAVGLTWLMFREKPGKEPEPAPAPTPPAPTPPPVVVPVPVPPPPLQLPCVMNLKRFKAWLLSKGFWGVWLDNVQTTPPILSALQADHPELVGKQWSVVAVATHGGDTLWYYDKDGEPYTQPSIRAEFCTWSRATYAL